MKTVYSKDDMKKLFEAYKQKKTLQEVAAMFPNRTLKSIKIKAQRMGITFKNRNND